MSVNVTVQEQKFLNQFKNGVAFGDNPLDFNTNLAGSVMENLKFITTIDINWSASVTAGDVWTADVVLSSISRALGNWFTDGFSVGDNCAWLENGVVTANITITAISNNGSTIFYTLNSGSITDTNSASLAGLEFLTALVYSFGLLGNNESFNVESKVSGNDQGFYGSGIGFDTGGGVRDTNWVNLQRLGSYQDWQTGNMRARFVSNPAYDIQRFEIEHTFTIVPYYTDGQLSNLQNDVIPNLLNGLNTLKYAFNVSFRTVLSNPNTEKESTIENNLGSVAWFGENFNGFNSNYNVVSVNYEEQATTNTANGLLISSKTKVTIVVNKSTGFFTVSERGGVYVSYLPEQNEYEDTSLTDLKENFLYDSALTNNGQLPVTGSDFISNFEIVIAGATMTLTFDVEYSIAQKLRLANLNAQNPRYFIIGVEVGDVVLSNGNSDRLILLADTELYDESADIPDLWSFPKMDIYTHEKQIGVDTGTTDVTDWVEDGLAIDYTMRLDLNKNALLNSMNFMIVAYDPITQIYFEIDKYIFNIFPAVISSGIQQLITNTTRGYILETGDQFNDVTLSVGANAGGFQDYDGVIAQKISWQDWLANQGVDTVFFDATKPNNNLNYKASNYSLLNGYEIRLAFFGNLFGTNTLGVSGLTDYLVLSPTITTFNYEEDGGVNIWSHVIETFDATGTTNLNGAVLTGQDTLFRSTWTNSGGAVASLTGLWGINRIEETDQQGYAISEMSSINLPPTGQLLKPNSGVKLLMYLNAGNVVMECFIDGSVATPNIGYNLSTRIQDDNVVIEGKQKAESTDLKQKAESTDVKQKAP